MPTIVFVRLRVHFIRKDVYPIYNFLLFSYFGLHHLSADGRSIHFSCSSHYIPTVCCIISPHSRLLKLAMTVACWQQNVRRMKSFGLRILILQAMACNYAAPRQNCPAALLKIKILYCYLRKESKNIGIRNVLVSLYCCDIQIFSLWPLGCEPKGSPDISPELCCLLLKDLPRRGASKFFLTFAESRRAWGLWPILVLLKSQV